MIVYLVRHASAGHRASWDGEDRLRPLDERGARQADGIVELLARREFKRIVSSPAVRCVDTVVPLAHARGLAVEHSEALAEGAGAEAALALFRGASVPLVACAGILVGMLPAFLAPPLPRPATAPLPAAAPRTEVAA